MHLWGGFLPSFSRSDCPCHQSPFNPLNAPFHFFDRAAICFGTTTRFLPYCSFFTWSVLPLSRLSWCIFSSDQLSAEPILFPWSNIPPVNLIRHIKIICLFYSAVLYLASWLAPLTSIEQRLDRREDEGDINERCKVRLLMSSYCTHHKLRSRVLSYCFSRVSTFSLSYTQLVLCNRESSRDIYSE